MPISVRCPTCDATLPVPDDRAGKHVRCGGCQNVLPVPQHRMARPVTARPASAAPAKRRPPAEWDDDIDDRPRRKAKNDNTALWAGGAALAFVFLGLTGYGAWVAFGRRNVVAQGPPPVVNPPAFNPQQPAGKNPPPVIGFRPPDAAAPPPLVFDPPPDPAQRFDPNAGRPFGPPVVPGRATTRVGLVGKHRDRVTIDASSQWASEQWTAASAFDGNDQTTWYAQEHAGGNPWLRVTFPEDVTVTTVTVRGTRDPNYPNGYLVTAGTIDLLSADGTVLVSRATTATPAARDHILQLPPTAGVRAVRFTATKGESLSNAAMGEFVVE